METCPKDWLVEPLALDEIEVSLGHHVSHPNWQLVKRLVQAGDEFWRFRSPPHTWPNKVGAGGYALVRAGTPVACFTIVRS